MFHQFLYYYIYLNVIGRQLKINHSIVTDNQSTVKYEWDPVVLKGHIHLEGNDSAQECSWTGNTGGSDMWVYTNENNQRIYQSQVKTRFQRYSPNLTETSISAYSSDNKLKLDYTFYLNRSDYFLRVYYKIKVKALEATAFNRFDIFQLGGDVYNLHKAQTVVYGNDEGR